MNGKIRRSMYCVFGLMIVAGVGFLIMDFYFSNFIVPKRFFKDLIYYPSEANETKKINHRQSINLTDGKNIFHMDLNRFQAEYSYMQDYSCKVNISDPEICSTPKSSKLLLIATNSYTNSFSKRLALRRAYAKRQQIKDYLVVTVFMLAMTHDKGMMELVGVESRQHGDIIVWDFEEHRANLTLKISCLLEWLNDECTSADYFVKADDDEFVNPEAIVNYISDDKNATKFIAGYVYRHGQVYRYGRNKVSLNLYSDDIYPDFPSGGGYIVPRSFIPELYRKSKTLPMFPVDDVFMGFMALASNIPLKHEERFYVWGLEYSVQLYKDAFIVHSLAAEKVVEMWENLQKEKKKETV
ncbi:beta-1,3-galactosyltransferase 5-like [Cetorhinus maximus]